MKIALLALVFAGGLWADDVTLTDGEPNGHFWQAHSVTEKLAFLAGYDAGATAALIEDQGQAKHTSENNSTVSPNASLTRGDLMDGLNEFYQHPENRILPIRVGILLFYDKVRGASAECREAKADFWRAPLPSPESTLAMERWVRFCKVAPKAEPKPGAAVFK